jgi:hypothetical protein
VPLEVMAMKTGQGHLLSDANKQRKIIGFNATTNEESL